MTVAYLWRIEDGRQNLSFRNVARLANAFGITLSDMLQGVDPGVVEQDVRPYRRADQSVDPAGSESR